MLALGLLVFAAACGRPYRIDPPRDFVVFDREDDFKAISADGIRFLAREIPNRPKGDLALWGRAIALQLDRQGYTIEKDERVTAASGLDGRLFASSYLLRDVKYAYWTAIFVRDDTLVLIESSAPADDFAKHADAIRAAIRSLRL